MANTLYSLGRQAFLTAGINWGSDTINVVLVRTVAGPNAGSNSVYTAAPTTDQYYSAIPNNTYCRAVTPITLTSVGDTDGVASAANVTFTSVASGDAIQAIVIYKSTGVDTTSPLIAYIDTATGLPVTPGGGNITISWDTGANKIFTL